MGSEVLVLLLFVVLFAVAFKFVRRNVNAAGDPVEPASDAQPVENEMPDAPQEPNIYEIASRLIDYFNAIVHPAELEPFPVFREGVDFLSSDAASPEDVIRFATSDHVPISCMALEALRQRTDAAGNWGEVLFGIGSMAPFQHYFALKYLAEAAPVETPLSSRVLGSTTRYLANRMSRKALEGLVRQRKEMGENLAFDERDIEFLNSEAMGALAKFLTDLDPELGVPLLDSMEDIRPRHRQPDQPPGFFDQGDPLDTVGRVWTKQDADRAGTLARNPDIDAEVAEIKALITADRPQSVLLVGEAGVGKTTLQRLLAQDLFAEGWTVFVAGHTDLLAGQVYIGQFEQRIKQLIDRLQQARKLLWHIPDIDQLIFTGTHSHSRFSAMDAIFPHIANGSLRIIAGIEPSAHDRMVRNQPRIASTMAVRKIRPASKEATVAIAGQWLGGIGLAFEDGLLEETWDLAKQYLGSRAAPGNVMDLLKATVLRHAGDRGVQSESITQDQVIDTLAGQSGLPIEILDQKRALDLDDLRGALTTSVIGQDEAISCLVDRVAMIKASLLDPARPFGVFLFAGPTGTGKTEIAKSLAAWLFGSRDRLIRVDMSELQDPHSLDRLIGGSEHGSGESLPDQIRSQPFSVVLLDEFEKAHPKVWDLFLQVFDDGRITDRSGRTTSFRNAIIIMTANLGATIPTGYSVGFASTGRGFDEGEVHAAIERAFRREFVNRIDQVVVFRPLGREIMRQILHRELEKAFGRRGLRGRPWAVEWDESAIELLLEKGFTEDLGARPLRRAVEQLLLAPLANTIVHHNVPEGDQFLFISRRGSALRVEFVDPDLEDKTGAGGPVAGAESEAGEPSGDDPRSILLRPTGAASELAVLKTSLHAIEARVNSQDWAVRKQSLFAGMEAADFWERPERHSVLGALETIDRVERGLDRARGLQERLDGLGSRSKQSTRLVSALAQNLYLLAIASDDILSETPQDAFLMVEAKSIMSADAPEHLAFARKIASMYESWAARRNMRLTVLRRMQQSGKTETRAIYAVSGYGAYSILLPEAGLHVLEVPSEGSKTHKRFPVTVAVVAQPDEPPGPGEEDAVGQAVQTLGKAGKSNAATVRRYRELPSPLVRDDIRSWRTGRIDLVFGGDFDLIQ